MAKKQNLAQPEGGQTGRGKPAQALPTPAQIAQARQLLGWSVKRLARESGVGEHVIAAYEQEGRLVMPGRTPSGPGRLLTMAAAFRAVGVRFGAGRVFTANGAAAPRAASLCYVVTRVACDGCPVADDSFIQAQDDADALAQARRLVTPTTAVELWQSWRKIAYLPPASPTPPS